MFTNPGTDLVRRPITRVCVSQATENYDDEEIISSLKSSHSKATWLAIQKRNAQQDCAFSSQSCRWVLSEVEDLKEQEQDINHLLLESHTKSGSSRFDRTSIVSG